MNKEDILEKLRNLNNTGKQIKGKIKGTDEKEIKGIIIDEVSQMSGDNKYVIQKIDGGNKTFYRSGYYTFDSNFERLYFGESSPIMMESDFLFLINKAKQKGWL
jgi:hypothetical protein